MYPNKNINSNTSYLTTNRTNSNYSSTSSPITIPHSTNRLNRFYVHNPTRNEQDRSIDLDLGYNNSTENKQNPIYATIESPPQKIGSSIFYIDTESESFETISSISTESDDDEDDSYETVETPPPPLPPRNRSISSYTSDIHFDINPTYSSFDNHIYATLRPKLPPRNKDKAIVDENPCYQSVDTPPNVPPRDLHFHTRFRETYCNK